MSTTAPPFEAAFVGAAAALEALVTGAFLAAVAFFGAALALAIYFLEYKQVHTEGTQDYVVLWPHVQCCLS